MTQLAFLEMSAPLFETCLPRRDLTTGLIQNSAHTLCLSLGAYNINACVIREFWNHPLESLSLIPIEKTLRSESFMTCKIVKINYNGVIRCIICNMKV